MTALTQLNTAFGELLQTYEGGISNTSTVKYDSIKAVVARATGLPERDIYATGTTSARISNLDTRYAQGNQRGQHATLALAFVRINPSDGGDTREALIKQFTDRTFTTSRKFVSGEERGTTFDGILVLVQFENETELAPAGLLAREGWQGVTAVKDAFGIERVETIRPVVSTGPAPMAEGSQPALPAGDDWPDLLRSCAAALRATGLRIPTELLHRFLASLLSKPFVILQGLSGSGKSVLAMAVARWFQELEDQVRLVVVGPDWTSNEHVLGYQDALDPGVYRRPPSGALDVLIAAKRDPGRPYFLILDEMNLSHVERYFADLLSAIESGQEIALHTADADVAGVPPRLPLPRNLFVVGTVNVDETTFGFSPKVLDRANVLEFRVSHDDLAGFLREPRRLDLTSLGGAGSVYSRTFADAAVRDVSIASLRPPLADGADVVLRLNEALLALFDQLAPHGWEFGFRVVLEAHRFVYWHSVLAAIGQSGEPATWALREALDAQVVQKIMPKLHGSERRLRPVLDLLVRFAEEHELTLTASKANRMLDRARDGFVTFAES